MISCKGKSLLLPSQVGFPDSIPLALTGFLPLGQQAGPQPLQTWGEGHLHVHVLACPLLLASCLHQTLFVGSSSQDEFVHLCCLFVHALGFQVQESKREGVAITCTDCVARRGSCSTPKM